MTTFKNNNQEQIVNQKSFVWTSVEKEIVCVGSGVMVSRLDFKQDP